MTLTDVFIKFELCCLKPLAAQTARIQNLLTQLHLIYTCFVHRCLLSSNLGRVLSSTIS